MKHCPEGQIPDTWKVVEGWDYKRELAELLRQRETPTAPKEG